jgi:hypothetical protein
MPLILPAQSTNYSFLAHLRKLNKFQFLSWAAVRNGNSYAKICSPLILLQ